MDTTLFRYWFWPPRWRRWSDGRRFAFLGLLLALVGGFSFLPLLLLPARMGEGLNGYLELLLGVLFFLIVNVACALAGATLITRERELGAWEALVLTPVGMPAIVRGKWLARTVLAMGGIGVFVPFWLLFTGVVLFLNDGEERAYYTGDGKLPFVWTAARLGFFLGWLAVRILGHAVPFVSIGLLVSALCRKTRAAIGLTATTVVLILPVALYLLFWGLSRIDQELDFVSSAILWPILPNDFNSFTAHSLVSTHWAFDLTADILWIVVLPAALLLLTLRLCRRPERLSIRRKGKPGSHGV